MSTSGQCTIWAFHPAGSTRALWEPVRQLVPDLHLDAPDLNLVASSLPDWAPYRDLVDSLIERAPPGPLVLTGAGFGARLAVSVARKLDERVRAIYLITPTPAEEDEAFLSKLAGLRRFMIDGFSEAQLQTLVPAMLHRWGPRFAVAARELEAILRTGSGGGGAALGRFCLALDEQPADWVHHIRAPIEAIYGSGDPVFEQREADSWRRLPIRAVHVLHGVANQPPLEIPERIAADLRRLVGGE